MMTTHQIAARLTFAAGLAFIFLVMGAKAFAGAGMALLLLLACREIELRGRRKQTEQEHWPTSRSPSQPLD